MLRTCDAPVTHSAQIPLFKMRSEGLWDHSRTHVAGDGALPRLTSRLPPQTTAVEPALSEVAAGVARPGPVRNSWYEVRTTRPQTGGGRRSLQTLIPRSLILEAAVRSWLSIFGLQGGAIGDIQAMAGSVPDYDSSSSRVSHHGRPSQHYIAADSRRRL